MPNSQITWSASVSTRRGHPFRLGCGIVSGVLGIVLTGASFDGAAGSRLIDSVGGIVIAQDRAQFRSMPEAAIETGCVDFVLPFDKIAFAIIGLTMILGAAEWLQRRTDLVVELAHLPEVSSAEASAKLRREIG